MKKLLMILDDKAKVENYKYYMREFDYIQIVYANLQELNKKYWDWIKKIEEEEGPRYRENVSIEEDEKFRIIEVSAEIVRYLKKLGIKKYWENEDDRLENGILLSKDYDYIIDLNDKEIENELYYRIGREGEFGIFLEPIE